MNLSTSKRFRRTALIVAVIGLIWIILRATWYIARLPDSNCETKVVLDARSADLAYRATLLEKDCNSGETLFHLLNIDTPHGNIRNFELDSDQMRPARPTMQWKEPHNLVVVIPSDNLTGTLTQHWSDWLILVRTYTPSAREQ